MKLLAIAVLGIITLPWSYAQERLILNADLTRQRLDTPVIGGSVSGPFIGAVTDEPPRPAPFSLALVSLRMRAAEPGSKRPDSTHQLDYELRFTNTSQTPAEIPVNPDRSKVFHACDDKLEEVSVYLRVRENGRTKQSLPGALWSGCHKMDESLITLRPGEWITYRGSVPLPNNEAGSDEIVASWTIADDTYTRKPQGLTEDSVGRVSVDSPGKTLDLH